jgi:hypothetical protein
MATLVWDGLDELKAQLRALPAELTGEAAHVIQATANRAEADMSAAYAAHRRSGELADALKQVERDNRTEFGYAITMINTSPVAWIFENGTQARHRGLRSTGAMPAGHVFLPAMIHNRAWMYGQLKGVLTRAGLGVTGDV